MIEFQSNGWKVSDVMRLDLKFSWAGYFEIQYTYRNTYAGLKVLHMKLIDDIDGAYKIWCDEQTTTIATGILTFGVLQVKDAGFQEDCQCLSIKSSALVIAKVGN